MAKTLIRLHGVKKSFAEIEALSHIDLKINSGQIVGLVGGNGAGKTTLLRLIAGTYSPTAGEVTFGKEPLASMRHKLGVVPEATGLYHRLTAWENIRYHSRIH